LYAAGLLQRCVVRCSSRQYSEVEPCADVILSAAARRVILTGGGGAPIHFFRRRRHHLNVGGGGVWRRGSQE